jgi:phosphopantothenoylcysteine decarboxylase/phosphopantothenate--cysteine ligase
LAGRTVLLGVTGGIAAYKAALLARLLTGEGAAVSVVMTDTATRFVGPDTFAALTGRPVHTSLWERLGEVLHVRLAHEVDVAVVAPATANVIGKLAHGLADDLLTSTLLEYAGPLVVAPAMHTGMWSAEATRRNVAALVERGGHIVGPVEGALAHGDEGPGRMAEPATILDAVIGAFTPRSLHGRRLLITAGPTHEPIDPVRFVGNRSTGRMGVAIAEAALARGAEVSMVLGPGTVDPPAGCDVIRIETADELRDAVLARFDDVDALVMAAAVADFRPKAAAEAKLKKDAGLPEIVFEPTPDILRELGERRTRQVLVGFAAETGDVEAEGRRKLTSKGVDLLVANVVGRPGTGFGSDTNEAAIVSADGDDEPLRPITKRQLAVTVCERIARLLDVR